MRNLLLLVFAGGAFCAASQLFGQQPAVPPVLRLFREDIKEGKGGAHEKSEAAFMQAAAKAKYPSNVLGMTAVTGTSQAWFLEGHPSFASIADSIATLDKPEFGALDAADAELRSSSRSMIAVYRPDLSYAVEKTNLPKARYISIETIQTRAGQGPAFTVLAKMLKDAAEKSGDTQPIATYQMVSGAPAGIYLLLEPMESLKSMDEEQPRQQAILQALGAEGVQRYAEAASEAIASSETLLYSIDPKMSYVPKEWAAADPGFWGQKLVKTAKAPAKAPAPKEKTASR